MTWSFFKKPMIKALQMANYAVGGITLYQLLTDPEMSKTEAFSFLACYLYSAYALSNKNNSFFMIEYSLNVATLSISAYKKLALNHDSEPLINEGWKMAVNTANIGTIMAAI